MYIELPICSSPFSPGTLNNPLSYMHIYTYDLFLFFYVHVSVSCAFVSYACSCCLQNPEEGIASPGAGISGGCGLLNMETRKQV